MISDGHPYYFLSNLLNKPGAIFHLSRYVYTPDSLLDEREAISVDVDDFTEQWVSQALNGLAANQELAFHSTVIIGGRTWHIPMIDFAQEEPLSGEVVDRVRQFLPRSVAMNMAVFSSGRSFHAYSVSLLSPKEWLNFMGRLLLVNPRGAKEIIDSRWIGHRLIGGFCSLRWSNNSGLYRGEPVRIPLPM